MKKIIILAVTLIMTVAMLTGCGGGGGSLTFSTGGDQGTYYGFGSVLAGQVSGSTDTVVTAITSGGSQANIEALAAGDAQIGFAQTDVMAYAYNGTNLFEETGAIDSISTVAALYLEQVQIVTTDPSIKTVADLKGKTVSIGAAGSGVYFNAIDILNAYGISEEDIKPTYESFGDSADSLKDKKIDAAFIVAGAPTTAITSLATSTDVYLVGMDSEHIATLQDASPYYTEVVIPAGTYDGIDEDVTTVAVGAVVVATDDASEEDIYNFVSGIYENIDEITVAHANGSQLDVEYAASIESIPYHPGAAKYFSEQGIEVPVK